MIDKAAIVRRLTENLRIVEGSPRYAETLHWLDIMRQHNAGLIDWADVPWPIKEWGYTHPDWENSGT
jgi:hypothetical protein